MADRLTNRFSGPAVPAAERCRSTDPEAKMRFRGIIANVRGWAFPKWTGKALSFAWFAFVGVVGYLVISNDLVHFQVEKRLGEQEIVGKKPLHKGILTEDIPAIDPDGRTIGELKKHTLLYFESQPEGNGGFPARLYAWIWAASVSEHDGFLALETDENIRYRANTTMVGRLKNGTLLKMEYLNEAGTWYLFSTSVVVPVAKLQVLPNEHRGFWAKLTALRAIVTVTSRKGGVPHTYNVLEPTLTIIFVLLLASTGVFRLRNVPDDHRKDFYLEVLKAGLQVGVGVLIAFFVFGFGLK